MNNTDLVRKLIREFLLLEENTISLQDKYKLWRENFRKKVKEDFSLGKYKSEPFVTKLLSVPENLEKYDAWINKYFSSIKSWPDLIEQLKLPKSLFAEFTQEQLQKIKEAPNGFDLLQRSDFIPANVRGYKNINQKSKHQYCEDIIANCLGGTVTPGKYDAYDVNLELQGITFKFEVKSLSKGKDGVIRKEISRPGYTAVAKGKEFINLISKFFNDFKSFLSIINHFNIPENEKQQLKNLYDSFKIDNIQDISKGEFSNGRFKNLEDLFIFFDSIQIKQSTLFDTKAISFDAGISGVKRIKIPYDKKNVYYKVIMTLKNNNIPEVDDLILGMSSQDKKDFSDNFFRKLKESLEEIKTLKNIISNPVNSFSEAGISGLFIVHDVQKRENSQVTYIPINQLNQHLIFVRITENKPRFILK